MEVIIIGAGTTGLLLAQGLKQAGIKATVYERETPDYYHGRPREWGMSLHWGTEAVNRVLPPELTARIKEVWCDPSHVWDGEPNIPQFAGHSGELLFRMPVTGGMRVSRRKMRELFSEGIDIQYGKRLLSIADEGDTVTAAFEDGSKATGSIIIGCDGPRSAVREALVGEEKARNTYLPYSLINFTTTFDADTARLIRSTHPIWQIVYHEKSWMFWLSAQDIRDPADPTTWSSQVMFSWKGAPSREELATQEDRTVFLKSKASEFAEPWCTVLNNVPADSTFIVDRLATWVPFDWSNMPLAGKVTLAGDAAHCMAPYRGQGLNNGLEDAALITELLTKAGVNISGWMAAIQQYEVAMRERAAREVQMSNIAADMAHNFEAFMNGPLAQFGVRKVRDEDLQKQQSTHSK